jgi:hypothetical protein
VSVYADMYYYYYGVHVCEKKKCVIYCVLLLHQSAFPFGVTTMIVVEAAEA